MLITQSFKVISVEVCIGDIIKQGLESAEVHLFLNSIQIHIHKLSPVNAASTRHTSILKHELRLQWDVFLGKETINRISHVYKASTL